MADSFPYSYEVVAANTTSSSVTVVYKPQDTTLSDVTVEVKLLDPTDATKVSADIQERAPIQHWIKEKTVLGAAKPKKNATALKALVGKADTFEVQVVSAPDLFTRSELRTKISKSSESI